MFKNFVILIILLFMSPIQASPDSKLIPRETLFGNPDKTSVSLSHDGMKIAYLAPYNGVMNIFVSSLDKPLEGKPITNETERGIQGYFWSYNNNYILFFKDTKGDENSKLYSYDLSTGESKLLTPEKAVRCLVFKMSSSYPNELVIGTNERDPKYFDAYKLDLLTGKKTLVFQNNKYKSFVFDNNLDLRFASFEESDGSTVYDEYIDNKFSSFIKFSFEDAANSYLVGLDKTGKNLYLIDSRNTDTSVFKKYNLDNKKISTILASTKADLELFTLDPKTHEIQGLIEDYEKPHYHILDNKIQNDITYLQKIERGNLNILSRTLDDDKWLVAYLSDNMPVKYYYYDRNNNKATYLFSNNKNLEKYELAEMHPVIIKSRDNLNLVSYITFPKNTIINTQLKPNNPLPMVLFVHGGPWARDSFGLNMTHQWLADRGYVVISTNYRNSVGFGKKFANAGNLEWGKKMHDDLIDVVNFAINNGIADKNKVAIYGGSYGGYAALCGVTLTPDVFACAVDLVGPSNLVTLLTSFPPYWTPIISKFKLAMGNVDTEQGKKDLLAVSPISYVDRIKKPLLIGQGDNDPRVTKIESDQIYEAMIQKNLPVIYLRFPDEGHGFVKASNKKAFFAVMEEFLSKHLGGKLEKLTAEDFKDANVILNNEQITTNNLSNLLDIKN